MRIDPPPSPACATGTIPLATAAAEPPLEPPVLCVGFHGLCVGPVRLRLGRRHQPELGRVRLADDHEARRLELLEEVARGRRRRSSRSFNALLPRVVRRARERAVEILDDDRHARERTVGQPALHRGARPVESGWITAFSSPLSFSMRSIAASTSSSRRRLPGADELGLGGGVEGREIGHGPDATSSAVVT